MSPCSHRSYEGSMTPQICHKIPDGHIRRIMAAKLYLCIQFCCSMYCDDTLPETRSYRPSPDGYNGCQTKQEIELLDLILKNSSIYDKRITPTAHHGIDEPTEVICNIDIRSLWSLSHQTMDFQTDMYLYQHWYDWRLVDKRFTRPIDFNDPEIIKAIWKPDIYFPNAKSGNFQDVAVPNVLLRLDQDGRVTLMFRLTMKFSCMMELGKYPFDNQTCIMEISTFAKTEKELILKWRAEEPIRLHPKLAQLPNFEIVRPTAEECDEVYAMGKYSCLEANLLLHRRRGYHIVQNYIPTILIVVISWVSFWMDVDAVPGRISLGITTLLTVTAKVTGVQQKLPEVSYIKAIDVWMGTCTAMVFCALCEFILANYRHRREKSKAQQYQMVQATKTDPAAPEAPGLVNTEIRLYTISGKKVDQIARVAFPVVFFVFNIIYWCVYLT